MKKAGRLLSALLVLCLCVGMMALSASADDVIIEKILTTTNLPDPVVLMDVWNITANSSGTGYSIRSITWYDENGVPAAGQFENKTYTLEICVDLAVGYVFSDSCTGYINNSAATVSIDPSGTFATLTQIKPAIVWAPTVHKHPGGETVEEGGWASFVATASYAVSSEWFAMGPNGEKLNAEEVKSRFPGMSFESSQESRLNLSNIPYEFDGWGVMCVFNGVQGFTNTSTAWVKVNPLPGHEPEPSPEVTEKPEEESPEDPAETAPEEESPAAHEHSFTAWKADAQSHSRSCACGETEQGAHELVWETVREATKKAPGEEQGTCKVCGYTENRALEYSGKTNEGAGVVKTVLLCIAGLAALTVILLIADYVRTQKRRSRRSRH